ncbi:MAG: alpha-glucosidase C-terminal domain-containing protein [Chloroflexi bacterium]|nr:alpha-glucosidase C-terminal domain-containing protein [Chloroflexota bacterium]
MNAPTWIRDAIFYQIFPERFANGDPSNDPPGSASWDEDMPTRENFFGGDLAGIAQHADHFQRLGVNALYLTPIFAAATNHKYDTQDYLSIDPAFGTLDTFRHLVSTLHDAQVRLVLDAVFNHCGDGFWAFQDVLEHGPASRYWDWFIVDSYPIQFDPPSYQTCGGAPFLPKLNTNNPEVLAYVLEVARYWGALGIDGWRLDVPWKVEGPFWQAFKDTVLGLNPDSYLVAEVWRGTRDWLKGDRVHGVMNYRLRANILDYAVFDHMDAEDFDYEVRQLLSEHGETAPYHLTLLGCHDTPRIHTLCKGDTGRHLIALALQMTLPGVPMIYYGDEIGMEGENDPDCRRPMIWREDRWNRTLFDATCTLTRLRREHPALRLGDVRTLRTFNGVYAYARTYEDDAVVVILNPRMEQPSLRIPVGEVSGATHWRDAITNARISAEDGMISLLPLRSRSVYVLITDTQGETHNT